MEAKERHKLVSECFLAVQGMGEAERAAWLDRECGRDAGLRAEVLAMLAADAGPAVVDPPALGTGFRAPTPASLEMACGPLPARIGRYAVKGVLGRGGMGVVYLAEQERPHRMVAVKVLPAGVASPSSLRRFEMEAEVLARLEHPGIARVFEAGVQESEAGPLSYFAMELVDGEPITRYAQTRNLDVPARLRLLAGVCDAVQHAHAKGVVHCDLKPANILVDRSGQPKVLDFGVARVADAEGMGTFRTDARQIIGTLPYMSPEQAGGDSRDVDTRADVYSLGVLLYEVLSGKRPFDLTGRMVHEAIRVIREEEPSRLSAINRALRGDVETIAATALRKDPAGRYQTAADLASDIRRSLASEPIAAHPPSAAYEIGRFVRRHRWVVLQAAVAAAVVLAALAMLLVATSRHREERRLKAARSAAIERFVTDIAEGLVRRSSAGDRVAAGEVFGAAEALLDPGLWPDEPEHAVAIHRAFGNAAHLMGLPAVGIKHFRAVLDHLQEREPHNEELIDRAKNMLALMLSDSGRPGEGAVLLREVADSLNRRWGGGSAAEGVALGSLAGALSDAGDDAGAVAARRRALELFLVHPPRSPLEIVDARDHLGEALRKVGRLDEAEAVLRESLTHSAGLESAHVGASIRAVRFLSRVELSRGNAAEALRLAGLALDRTLALPQPSAARIASAHVDMSAALDAAGDVAGAESHLRQALEACDRLPDRFPANRIKVLTRLVELLGRDPARGGEIARLLETRKRLERAFLGQEGP